MVKGRIWSRGESKRTDFLLSYKPNIPVAIIEAKDNNHGIGDGMQQALVYAEMMDVPFVYSTNGDAFIEHDRTAKSGQSKESLHLMLFLPLKSCGGDTVPGKVLMKRISRSLPRIITLTAAAKFPGITSLSL